MTKQCFHSRFAASSKRPSLSHSAQGQTGFTLVEVLVALVILALVGVAVASVSSQQLRSVERLEQGVNAAGELNSVLALADAQKTPSEFNANFKDPSVSVEEGLTKLSLSSESNQSLIVLEFRP